MYYSFYSDGTPAEFITFEEFFEYVQTEDGRGVNGYMDDLGIYFAFVEEPQEGYFDSATFTSKNAPEREKGDGSESVFIKYLENQMFGDDETFSDAAIEIQDQTLVISFSMPEEYLQYLSDDYEWITDYLVSEVTDVYLMAEKAYLDVDQAKFQIFSQEGEPVAEFAYPEE